MSYSIGEVAVKTGLSVSTLRYYDACGLLPEVSRTQGNIRAFSDEDLGWLDMLDCLKRSGMQLKDIKQFLEWCAEGDGTIDKRLDMFLRIKAETEAKLCELQRTLDHVNFKCEYYRIAKEHGTTQTPELKNLVYVRAE